MNRNTRLRQQQEPSGYEMVQIRVISKSYSQVRAIVGELGQSDTDLLRGLRECHGINFDSLHVDPTLHIVVSSQHGGVHQERRQPDLAPVDPDQRDDCAGLRGSNPEVARQEGQGGRAGHAEDYRMITLFLLSPIIAAFFTLIVLFVVISYDGNKRKCHYCGKTVHLFCENRMQMSPTHNRCQREIIHKLMQQPGRGATVMREVLDWNAATGDHQHIL